MPSVLDQICREFERAWKQGRPLQIETALEQCDPSQQEHLLHQLLLIEFEQRHAAGQQPIVADYADRFPAHYSLILSLLKTPPMIEETVGIKTDQQEITADFTVNRQGSGPESSQLSSADQNTIRQSIGRYTVTGMLGRGGQADVYRAVHPTLPLEVAIKMTRTTLSEKAREALRAEAHILCDLDHPHIARIRDFDFDEGRPFMVLDFIRGRSLGQVAASEPYSPQAAALVVAKIARAIGFANSRGVIHRDLKPDNIVIDAEGEPKIIDFGMSRLRSGISGVTEEANEVSGTLVYMSPEQAAGITAKTDHRVDVFALGAILYRLLVGKAPYSALSSMSMLSIVRECRWDVAALECSSAPDDLKAICKRALSGDPVHRYATAEAMVEAISQFLLVEDDHKEIIDAKQTRSLSRSPATIVTILGIFTILIGIVYFVNPFGAVKSDSAVVSHDSAVNPNLIQHFELIHIGNSDDRAEFSGRLFQYRPPRENDDIQVNAAFGEPVYCFLVALNPDGVRQLCYPRDSSVAQTEPIKMLRYPADEETAFGLTDGVGQQAFVLYTSQVPLPAFDTWDSELLTASWPDPEVSGSWRYHNGQLEAIETQSSGSASTRGTERKTKTPILFRQLCDRLRQEGTSDVHGVTFEVKPRL